MDIKRMLYFCTIVEQGQISSAATKLNMSQPPLSQRLKELEEELGTTLIARNRGRWEVTEAGWALYREAQRILCLMENVRDTVKNATSKFRGTVRIGVSSRCLSFFSRIVPILAREYPEISCRVMVVDTAALEQKVRERELDLAIVFLPLAVENLEVIRLTPQHYVAVFSNLLPAPPERTVSLQELASYPLLIGRRWNLDFRPLMVAMQEQNLSPHILVDTHASYILFDMLYESPVVAVLNNTEIPPPHAHTFPVRPIALDRQFYPAIIYLKEGYLSLPSRKLIELITANITTAVHPFGISQPC